MSKISEVLRDRRGFVGGSDARIIMGNDEAALVRLWREKRGEVEPEDLSGNLIVQLGVATEALNRRWYEANTGRCHRQWETDPSGTLNLTHRFRWFLREGGADAEAGGADGIGCFEEARG